METTPSCPPSLFGGTSLASYKLSILEQYDACVGGDDESALLWRGALY